MSGDTVITHIGNLVDAPDLRFTPNGVAVANFTVAATPRVYDRQTNEWKDGEALFLRCNIWRDAAENLAESNLTKGTRVIVCGRLKQRSYEKDGEKRTIFELDVDEVAPSLRWARVNGVRRATKQEAPPNKQDSKPKGNAKRDASDDPWQMPKDGTFQGAPAFDDEPPF